MTGVRQKCRLQRVTARETRQPKLEGDLLHFLTQVLDALVSFCLPVVVVVVVVVVVAAAAAAAVIVVVVAVVAAAAGVIALASSLSREEAVEGASNKLVIVKKIDQQGRSPGLAVKR